MKSLRRTRFNSAGRRRPARLLLVLGLVLAGAGIAAQFSPLPKSIAGPAQVTDGDSLRIGDSRIRLFGIDAPEFDQQCRDVADRPWACGRAARDRLRELTGGQSLTCTPSEVDRYGRLVARCTVGGKDIAATLVAEGLAVSDGVYGPLEAEARGQKSGIWAGSFDRPARWRQANNEEPEGFDLFGWLRSLFR